MSDSAPIDIILPVYRDLDATQRAIRAVLESGNQAAWHLIIINDASPDPEMPALLESLCAGQANITLLSNEENLGFVRTVNRAMALHDDRDVVLLNSDTLVHGDWLDRMLAHIGEQTASITPFSNHATICSTPRIGEDNPDFERPAEQTAALDSVHAQVNAGANVPIPVGVGFCMWMSRRVMTQVGLFDAEAFGRGYGEECDWCLRAAAAGYQHLLACDVFVYHEGGSSFGDDAIDLKASSAKILRRRYPRFESDVSKWVKADTAAPYRLATIAQTYRQSGLPVILHITHHLGGGTQKNVDELCAHFATRAKHLIFTPTAGGGVRLYSANRDDGVDFISQLHDCLTALQDVFCAFGVSRIHLHNLLGFNEAQLRQLVQGYAAPLDVTIHDYFTLCPQVFLSAPDGSYCGEPDEAGCNACIAQRPAHGGLPIDQWRAHFGWWLKRADRIITPSLDAAARMTRYHPDAPIIALPHLEPELDIDALHYRIPTLAEDEPLRMVIIGALAKHKGSQRLRALAKAASNAGIALEIIHLGNVLDATPPAHCASVHFRSLGQYQESELPQRLADADPHLVWFPATWPETYSYTLSQAMLHGAPLWVPPSGSFSERASRYEWSFWCEVDATPEALAEQLQAIRVQLQAGQKPQPRPYHAPEGIALGDCDADYLNPPTAPTEPAPRQPNAPVRVGIILPDPQHPDACAVIRLLQPLHHPAMQDRAEPVLLSLSDVYRANVDALLIARTTACAPLLIDKLTRHAHSKNIPIIYDLDDDLLNLPPSHPEYEHYQRLKPGVEAWLRGADSVTVSTQTLHNEVAGYRSAKQSQPMILPNYLDERLWQLPDEEALARIQSAQPLKVTYIGTPTHQPDFAQIASAIRPVLRKHNASLTLIGVYRKADAPSWCEVLEPPEQARASYAAFARWLQEAQAEHGWHIGLAPLRELTFNQGKSGIKYMEYSALGLAGIYADLPGYRDVVAHDETGLLASASDAGAWARALGTLLEDGDKRLNTARAAIADVQSHHLMQADAPLWSAVLMNVLTAAPRNAQAALTPPTSQPSFAAAINAPAPSTWTKRLIRSFYHRYASHTAVRFVWARIPSNWQLSLKKRLRPSRS